MDHRQGGNGGTESSKQGGKKVSSFFFPVPHKTRGISCPDCCAWAFRFNSQHPAFYPSKSVRFCLRIRKWETSYHESFFRSRYNKIRALVPARVFYMLVGETMKKAGRTQRRSISLCWFTLTQMLILKKTHKKIIYIKSRLKGKVDNRMARK